MSPRTVERVDEWSAVTYGGGYAGLHDLADRTFSGVVTAGRAQLYMIRGTVVGVLDGSIEDFEGADGTAREAPHDALPLLAVMQDRSQEVRAKYYTEETPLEEVDATLSDGGFTGYIELSENVLSGDYYQVYHGGESMSVAYVGAAERLITGDEAFEAAADEVGIYEVRAVDVEPIEIPEAEAETGDAGSSLGGVGDEPDSADEHQTDVGVGDPASAVDPDETGTEVREAEPDDVGPDDRVDRAGDRESAADNQPHDGGEPSDPASGSDRERGTGSVAADDTPTGPPASDSPADERRVEPSESEPERETTRDDAEPETDGTRQEGSHEQARTEPPARESGAASAAGDTDAGTTSGSEQRPDDPDRTSGGDAAETVEEGDPTGTSEPASTTAPTDSGDRSTGGDERAAHSGESEPAAADLETRSIPSLDPARTRSSQADDATSALKEPREANERTAAAAGERSASVQGQPTPREQATQASESGGGGSDRESAPELRRELESVREERDELRGRLTDLEEERDDLREQLAHVESERDDFATEVDRLESELADARERVDRLEERLEELGASDEGGRQLSAREAIDRTNLFVRYDSKGGATLAAAGDGEADREAIAENLRLEYHTQFDADGALVGSESFDRFLVNTIQYRFVDWLVSTLLYEIRDTGSADAMRALYDALPAIDRAELNGQVSVEYQEDGQTHRSQEEFDVVVRDRMGNPLAVVSINDSRDPATDQMMTDLVTRAERVGTTSESLAAAFLVTGSFFEPGALETAEEATASGLFSRSKRKSFVNLSRKDGFHLCLVEARNEEFHLAVPEL